MTRLEQDDLDLVQSLVGRTISKALWFDESPNRSWTHHETCWLWLDDGRVIQFSSWGHDADGATIDQIEVMDVASCLHCGGEHKNMEIFLDPRERFVFCADGNHKAWREPEGEKDD